MSSRPEWAHGKRVPISPVDDGWLVTPAIANTLHPETGCEGRFVLGTLYGLAVPARTLTPALRRGVALHELLRHTLLRAPDDRDVHVDVVEAIAEAHDVEPGVLADGFATAAAVLPFGSLINVRPENEIRIDTPTVSVNLRPDCVATFASTGERVLIDWKWTAVRKPWHRRQLRLYVAALARRGERIDRAYLVYVGALSAGIEEVDISDGQPEAIWDELEQRVPRHRELVLSGGNGAVYRPSDNCWRCPFALRCPESPSAARQHFFSVEQNSSQFV